MSAPARALRALLRSAVAPLLLLAWDAHAEPAASDHEANGANARAAGGQAERPSPGTADAMVHALALEARRSLALELPGMPRPYLVHMSLIDRDDRIVSATLGALDTDVRQRRRTLGVEVKVGDYTFDSSNFFSEGTPWQATVVPFEDDAAVLRREAWLLADQSYKKAVSTFEAKRAARQSRSEEDRPPDYTPAPPVRFRGAELEPLADGSYVALVEELSGIFGEFTDVHESGVTVAASSERRAFVSSEGAEVVESKRVVELSVWARTQADDGMPLADHLSVVIDTVDADLRRELAAHVRELAAGLVALRKADVVKDYSGPVLFEDAAAPQLLRALLVEQLSATPPPESDGGPLGDESELEARLGWKVLPAGFSVSDDPARAELAGVPLIGGYTYDDEGVRGGAVSLVEDGKLTTLLSSRTPSRRVRGSNGHGHLGPSGLVRARASNLIVRSARGLSRAALRARLLREIRAEGLPYGLIVQKLDDPRLTGGVLEQERGFGTGAFVPMPVRLIELTRDGKQRIVRGGTLQGLSVRDLRYLIAASSSPNVHNYLAPGAGDSGFGYAADLPVSIAAPDLLVRDVDVRAPTAHYRKPPLITRPR